MTQCRTEAYHTAVTAAASALRIKARGWRETAQKAGRWSTCANGMAEKISAAKRDATVATATRTVDTNARRGGPVSYTHLTLPTNREV